MDVINLVCWLTEGFDTPDCYLGTIDEHLQFEDGRIAWSTKCVD